MIHEIVIVGLLQCNCSIFGDEDSREGIVIDPGDDLDEIQAVIEKHGLRVTSIVVTHAHIDHIGGAAKLRRLTGAPVYMNGMDAELAAHLDLQAEWLGVETPENPGIDVSAREGDLIRLGSSGFHVLETPGHTPGSISLYSRGENKLVAGDTLFRNSIGRTDLPGGDSGRIMSSIRGKLLILPEETIVIAGHGANSTIGREKHFNPFLLQR